jgi:hypothetical protein
VKKQDITFIVNQLEKNVRDTFDEPEYRFDESMLKISFEIFKRFAHRNRKRVEANK